MKLVIQRVKQAKVSFENIEKNINNGIVVFIGISKDDTEKNIQYLTDKILNLRIFPDEHGKFDKSIIDINGEILVISEFTLYGNCKKGRRPDFIQAADKLLAQNLYNKFIEYLKKSNLKVETGEFGKHMLVEIHNDGPVTLIIE